jgi:hypothetical protein
MLNETIPTLQHFPISLNRFGKTPYNENLYRIVFAPSRFHLIHGLWADGANGARLVPRYRAVGDAWILERWLSADEYAKCSRQKWERDLLILGPWPERGEYDLCHVFEACGPVDANLDKLIMWIEEGRKRSFQDNRDACGAEYEQEDKDIRNTQDATIRNLLPAFGTSPMVGFGGGRGTKGDAIVKSANELKLPMGHNKLTVGKRVNVS